MTDDDDLPGSGAGISYSVCPETGTVTFSCPVPADMAKQIAESARLSRRLNRGDVEDVLSALARIEALLQKPE